MPNPKLGTVTDDVPKAVSDNMKGSVVLKVTKNGAIFLPLGKVSMGCKALAENAKAILHAINTSKPTDAKGVKTGRAFWVKAAVTRTQGGWKGFADTATVDPGSPRYFRGGEDLIPQEEKGAEVA